MPGILTSFYYELKSEFQIENFAFSHEPPMDFCKCLWQKSEKNIWWVIYRWCSFSCLSLAVYLGIREHLPICFWFIYFTNWGYGLLLICFAYGSIISTIYYIEPTHFSSNCCSLKCYWFIYWLSAVVGVCITFVYWPLRFSGIENTHLTLAGIWTHGVNCFFILLDFMLIAFPTRLLHVVYPFTLGIVYVLFSIIYHKAKGRNLCGRYYIYRNLDWSKPLNAVRTSLRNLFITIIFSIVLFFLYKLRTILHRKYLLKSTELSKNKSSNTNIS